MLLALLKATSWGLQVALLPAVPTPRDKFPPAPSSPPTPEVSDPGDLHICWSLLSFLPVSWLCGLGRLGAQARRPDSVNIYSQAQEAISFLFLLLIERGESGCNTSKGLKAQPERPAELGRRRRECFINAGASPASPEGRCVFLFAARQCLPFRLPYCPALCVSFSFGSLP